MDPTFKCFVTSFDFHRIYHDCFVREPQPLYPSQETTDVKYAIIDLLIIDPENRDKKIIESAIKIKEIFNKTPKPAVYFQLCESCDNIQDYKQSEKLRKIKDAKAFWAMFTQPFDKHEAVKKVLLNRIKALQDDFAKHGITDLGSLMTSLGKEIFKEHNPPKDNTDPSKSKENPKDSYFKEGGKSSASVGYQENGAQGDFFDKVNWYSERELEAMERNFPEAANMARHIREDFSRRAKAGELITEHVAVAQDPHSKKTKFILTPINPNPNPNPDVDRFYPLKTTMKALVYDEIINGQITTEDQMQRFVMEKFRDPNDLRFFQFMLNPNEFTKAFMYCWYSLASFKEFLKNDEASKLKPQESKPVEKPQLTEEDLVKTLQQANMYSESSLEKINAQHVSELRTIREEFTRRAKEGELITDCIVLTKDANSGLYSFEVKPYPKFKEDDVFPYCITMNALIYDEIANGRILTQEKMIEFIEKKCADTTNTLFIKYFTEFGSDKYNEIVKAAANKFKDFFEKGVKF